MKLWLLTQNELTGLEIYTGAVVCAKTEEDAKHIHPSGCLDEWWSEMDEWPDWPIPEAVNARFIGMANGDIKEGVVLCSSYLAG